MSKRSVSQEENANRRRKTTAKKQKETGVKSSPPSGPLAQLQHQVGNRAIQRLITQRSSNEPGEVDDETAQRINQKRGGGQALDSGVQKQMGDATGADFSQVKVHTDPESDNLSQQLGAKAFTTGKDIFFRDGNYQPYTSGGQELLAHELTHVVQQGQGHGAGNTRMQVNDPGDAYEHEADAVASSVTRGQAAGVQMQEEEEEVQMQETEEEEEVQMQEEEEEEQVQMQEEEEEVQMQEEEEEIQAQEDDELEENA